MSFIQSGALRFDVSHDGDVEVTIIDAPDYSGYRSADMEVERYLTPSEWASIVEHINAKLVDRVSSASTVDGEVPPTPR